ncbi:MAG TPA: hypothetical protein VEY30_09475 [Myxococcaceae bacterium]|nr:hypothetical protein [Myxococcaceae bacterium]
MKNNARHTLRSVGAVLAGLVSLAAISTLTDALLHATGVFSPYGQPMASALFLLPTAYRFLYGIGAGYLTARLAPDRPVRHALILGGIGVAISLAGAIATWNAGPEFGPKWYALAVIAIALPTTWLGARLFTPKADSSTRRCAPALT